MKYEYVLLHHSKPDGTQKLYLRVSHKSKKKRYPVVHNHKSIYITKKDLSKIGRTSKESLIQIRDHLAEDAKRVDSILAKMIVFDFEVFKAHYSHGILLSDCFDKKIKELQESNSFATRDNYIYAKKAFVKYLDISVTKIDDRYINGFIKLGGKKIYLQRLRHILNREGNNTKIKIEGTQARKIPLTAESIDLIKNYNTISLAKQRSVDLFLMSYYGGGMNMKDWVYLKVEHVKSDTIVKLRSKTEEQLSVVITAPLRYLLDKYVEVNNEYYFSFIDHTLNAEEKHIRYKTFLSNMRRSLRQVREELGIKENITPYIARHTHASVLHNSGASMEDIKDSLGQKDIRSTKAYVGSMNTENKKRIADLL